ncbi:Holliday junction branch migration DNA helicase RuvB [Williamsoniiplasma lucivorax]|uniref:Holliday junction branch migration complex subunit RuvB n=1 Tax=Williamsoniiplasma lucivorax TaxID=209274 RepID=A0A2S5RD86_9MOLU|nr:Holliday junction branch migration DNA helicase RuvB [Williamsoniiplasma lucivorax]PPE05172.1 Holliday junction DNA helicase RuvB [Williamsoniiplasma lucivorax]
MNNFRPETWDEYFGQKKIIQNLKVFVNSAVKRDRTLDHIVISGPSGMGKTSLAFLLSKILKVKLHYLNGPSLQKQSDLVSVLSFIKENDLVFIDEIHALSKELLEVLYPVLEDGKMNIIIGKEYNSKIINLKIPNFTLIVATTEISKLADPFLNRFPIRFELDNYSSEEIKDLLLINAQKLNLELNVGCAHILANHSRNTPRIAINLLKRIHDFVINDNVQLLDAKYLKEILHKMEIYPRGLILNDIKYLHYLYAHKVLGLNNLSQYLNLNQDHVLHFIEPLLIRNSFIIRTPKGRVITEQGIEYIKNISQ